MINHHPEPELLTEYVAGLLPEAVALVVATHAALCPECHQTVANLEAVGGAFLDNIVPSPFDEDDDLLDTVMSRLDETPAAVPTAPFALDVETLSIVPPALRRYVGRSLGDLAWRSVGRMFHEVRLPLANAAMKASLMRLRPGSLMPTHTHRGNEYTLVLAGGYTDAGRSFGRGDFDMKQLEEKHQPIVDADGECLCLVVLDAPVKLTGTMGLLVNPFLRI